MLKKQEQKSIFFYILLQNLSNSGPVTASVLRGYNGVKEAVNKGISGIRLPEIRLNPEQKHR